MVDIRNRTFSRRDLLVMGALATEALLLTACAAPAISQEDTPSENLDLAMAQAEATVSAGKLLRAQAKSHDYKELPANTPVPPTAKPTPRTEATKPAINPKALAAFRLGVDDWLGHLNMRYDHKDSPSIDESSLINHVTAFHAETQYLALPSLGSNFVEEMENFRELLIKGALRDPEKSHLRVRWEMHSIHRNPATKQRIFYRTAKSLTEIKDIQVSSGNVPLSREEIGDGYLWQEDISISYLRRYRTAVAIHKDSYPEIPALPDDLNSLPWRLEKYAVRLSNYMYPSSWVYHRNIPDGRGRSLKNMAEAETAVMPCNSDKISKEGCSAILPLVL